MLTQTSTCGFCTADFQRDEPKAYGSAVEPSLKMSQPELLYSQITREQTRKDSKKFNVINGTAPSDITTDEAIVQDLARALSAPVNPNEVLTKRFEKLQEHTGHQFLLIKFKDVLKKEFFSKLWKIAQL